MIICADKILINHWFDLKKFFERSWNWAKISTNLDHPWSIDFMKYNRFQCITVGRKRNKSINERNDWSIRAFRCIGSISIILQWERSKNGPTFTVFGASFRPSNVILRLCDHKKTFNTCFYLTLINPGFFFKSSLKH